MFFSGIERANSFKMNALVFDGLAKTSTYIIKAMKRHQLMKQYQVQKLTAWKGRLTEENTLKNSNI